MAQNTSNRWGRFHWLPQAATIFGAFMVLRWVSQFVYPNANEPISGGLQLVIYVIAITGLAVFVIGGATVLFATKKSVESMEIRAGAPDGWPPASFAMRDRVSKMGFEQFGSIDVTFPDHTATFAGMLSPDGTTMGIITPVHLVMMTDFDGKLLSTTNQPAGAPVRYELRQYHRDASPEELWELHKSGLATTAESGLTATVYNAASAMTAFVAIEQHASTQFAMRDQIKGLAMLLPLGRRTKTLAGSAATASRIAAWRASPDRWQPQVS